MFGPNSPPFDHNTISKVNDLKKNNIKDFNDSFYSDLSFGTGRNEGDCWCRTKPS